MDAGQAFPTNCVSFAAMALALFLNTKKVRFTYPNPAWNLLFLTSCRKIRRDELPLILAAVRAGLGLRRVPPSDPDPE